MTNKDKQLNILSDKVENLKRIKDTIQATGGLDATEWELILEAIDLYIDEIDALIRAYQEGQEHRPDEQGEGEGDREGRQETLPY